MVNLRSSLYFLIASNLIPLVMLISGKWDFREVIILYWAESGIIGFFNIFKIILVKKLTNENNKNNVNILNVPPRFLLKLFFAVFFCVHFGGFMAGHAVFLSGLILGAFDKNSSFGFNDFINYLYSVKTGIIALFISHGFSFFKNFIIEGEIETATIQDMFTAPYSRIVVMHITIIAGAFLMMLLKFPQIFSTVFVLLKIFLDTNAHLKERKKYSKI